MRRYIALTTADCPPTTLPFPYALAAWPVLGRTDRRVNRLARTARCLCGKSRGRVRSSIDGGGAPSPGPLPLPGLASLFCLSCMALGEAGLCVGERMRGVRRRDGPGGEGGSCIAIPRLPRSAGREPCGGGWWPLPPRRAADQWPPARWGGWACGRGLLACLADGRAAWRERCVACVVAFLAGWGDRGEPAARPVACGVVVLHCEGGGGTRRMGRRGTGAGSTTRLR